MNYETLLLQYDGSIASITFNRPEKRNSINYRLIDELLSALAELEKSEAQVLIMTGAGKAFCAGMDLDELKSLTGRTPEQNLQDSQTMALLFRSIYEFPKATIAAVNGPAIVAFGNS
jgi:methylglutaconyl-CoA hydratase